MVYVTYFENRPRLATNTDHRGSGKALKPGLPQYGSMKAFRPAARTRVAHDVYFRYDASTPAMRDVAR